MDASRLRWACRRGMLELDILLERYLVGRYESASADEQSAFEKLLSCQDQDLWNWLVSGELPDDTTLAGIVDIIRQHNAQICRD